MGGNDTFAPSLLGYGRSTTFEAGLDDPANASLRPHDGTCPYAEGCDSAPNPVFQLDQQGSDILTNPLGGQRLPHISAVRFARTDVWVRDVRQVIEDAIAQAQPTDGKVALVGYSLGALRLGRALDAVKFPEIVQRVSRVDFLSPIFGGPTEETPPAGGFVTFPLSLTERSEVVESDRMPNAERDAVCAGHRVEGGTDYAWAQLMNHDVVGRRWGGTDPADPAGVLVQLDCATHAMMWDGCSNAPRCIPASGIPYGGPPDRPSAGPHPTIKTALIEWITNGTFDGADIGTFVVDACGVARPDRT